MSLNELSCSILNCVRAIVVLAMQSLLEGMAISRINSV